MNLSRSVTDSFKNWALDASKKAALRWEDPNADEIPVVYAQDVYGDLHVLPVPAIYTMRAHSHLAWLAQTLPSEVRNRSLVRLAFRASVWAVPDTTYKDFSEDPRRQELLMVTIVEGKRAQAWGAPITRTASGLPKLAEWEQFADEDEGSGGPVHDYLHKALNEPVGKNGRTMPAANMVLGPYDVPADFFPDWRGEVCGPLNFLREVCQSSYRVLFRPERADHAILSQAICFKPSHDVSQYMAEALGALRSHNEELGGPAFGDEAHYFSGNLDGKRLHKLQAIWRHANVVMDLGLSGPPGTYRMGQLIHLASTQAARLDAELAA